MSHVPLGSICRRRTHNSVGTSRIPVSNSVRSLPLLIMCDPADAGAKSATDPSRRPREAGHPRAVGMRPSWGQGHRRGARRSTRGRPCGRGGPVLV